jgi:hypothetical protein
MYAYNKPEEGRPVRCVGQMQGFYFYSRWQIRIILGLKVELIPYEIHTQCLHNILTELTIRVAIVLHVDYRNRCPDCN